MEQFDIKSYNLCKGQNNVRKKFFLGEDIINFIAFRYTNQKYNVIFYA